MSPVCDADVNVRQASRARRDPGGPDGLRTLRHYEQLGLLAPERVGTSRVYRQRDRIRLELILRGKRLGFSLDQIGVIVNMYDEPPGEAGQLEFLIAQCDVRRSELHRLRDDIEATLVEIDRVEQRCRADLRALSR
jgi:DNA-binding transcriptional MerR regulator